MARVIQFHKTGGPEVLQIDEDRAEAMFRSGMYLEQSKLPGRLGYEAVSTVEAIGEGVTGFAISDNVRRNEMLQKSGHQDVVQRQPDGTWPPE